MNANTSPIAFYPNRASQPFRANYRQKEIATICGNNLPPFYVYNVDDDAPGTCELYDANTDVKVADLTCSPHLLTHTTSVDGKSVKMWIFQGTQGGIFGNASKGYFYLKIGSYYSDIFKIGDLPSEYVKLEWQIFDDIITTDGSLISKYVVYKQIFNTILWHPDYTIEEEGKTNNGIYYAMQQTTKKTSGFSTIVNESQCDVLSLIAPIADSIKITSCVNGQTREMRTNRFEIKSKWESDDVTHIECEFDLLTIIRKYQKSAFAPDPLPIPLPPPPPGVSLFVGSTKTNVASFGITLGNIYPNVNIPVSNKQFYEEFDPLPAGIYFDMRSSVNADIIESLDLSNFDFSQFEVIRFGASAANDRGLDQLISLYLPAAATFSHLFDAEVMFRKIGAVSINLPNATFESITNANYMFEAAKITALNLPKATFEAVEDCYGMFRAFPNLKQLSLPEATFTNAELMQIDSCSELLSISMPKATFHNGYFLITGNPKLTTINMPLAEMNYSQAGTFAPFSQNDNLETIVLKAGDYMGLDSGNDTFEFRYTGTKLSAASVINLLSICKTNTSGTATNNFRIANALWNTFSQSQRTSITNAVKTGWTFAHDL